MSAIKVREAAWDLLDAMHNADFARDSDAQQEARQAVTTARENLIKILNDEENDAI